MDFSVCKKNIIRKNSGELLNFYIHNGNIYCKRMNDESESDVEILKNVKTYDLAIDFKDNVHLLCVTNCGKLCYCIYSSDTVKTNILKDYRPCINQIEKVNLLSIGKKMHMFYSFEKLGEKNLKIVHIYLEGNKWRTNYIDIEASHENGLRYMVDYNSEGDIFLIYKDLEKKSCIRIYYDNLKKWKCAMYLNLNSDDIQFENILVDSINNIHILYTSKNGEKNLNHVYKNTQELLNESSWIKYTFDKVDYKCDFKIYEYNRNIFIVWNINRTINIRNSIGDISKWNTTKLTALCDIKSIKYIGNKYKNRKIDKSIDCLGVIEDDDIKFVCIDRGIEFKECKEENIKNEELKKQELIKEKLRKDKIRKDKIRKEEQRKQELKKEIKQKMIEENVQSKIKVNSEKTIEKEINVNNAFRSDKEEKKESFIGSLKKYFNL